jgi:hypothetical protein
MFEKADDGNATALPEKINEELAINEFEKYCEVNDIDFNEADMNEEEKNSFGAIKRRFLKACRAGRVVVDGRELEYTISDFSKKHKGEKIKFERPTGKSFMAMDSFKDRENVAKLQAFASAATGQRVSFFSELDTADWLFFRDLVTLFLSV